MTTVAETVWNCPKWADCSCTASSHKACECGTTCSCGTVKVEDVKRAMETMCPKLDCNCNMACRCNKGECSSGSMERSPEQWVAFVKAKAGACRCVKADNNSYSCETCVCPDKCCSA